MPKSKMSPPPNPGKRGSNLNPDQGSATQPGAMRPADILKGSTHLGQVSPAERAKKV